MDDIEMVGPPRRETWQAIMFDTPVIHFLHIKTKHPWFLIYQFGSAVAKEGAEGTQMLD